MVSAIGVLMLIVAATAIAVSTHLDAHGPKTAATRAVANKQVPSTRAAGKAVSSADNPRGCHLPAGNQTVPVTAPSSSWTLVGAMAAPNAPGSFGPQKVQNGLRVCFAHNPTGALYALASFFAESTQRAPSRAV